jgi:hypothetical protein
LGAAASGARYIKAGLHGVRGDGQALDVMRAVVRACKEHDPRTVVVAAGYADYRRFGGIDPHAVVRAGHAAGADLVMLDTALKDGPALFDALTPGELADFVGAARARGCGWRWPARSGPSTSTPCGGWVPTWWGSAAPSAGAAPGRARSTRPWSAPSSPRPGRRAPPEAAGARRPIARRTPGPCPRDEKRDGLLASSGHSPAPARPSRFRPLSG